MQIDEDLVHLTAGMAVTVEIKTNFAEPDDHQCIGDP
jgi:hypothetical protein